MGLVEIEIAIGIGFWHLGSSIFSLLRPSEGGIRFDVFERQTPYKPISIPISISIPIKIIFSDGLTANEP
jgi:hypothetical protein